MLAIVFISIGIIIDQLTKVLAVRYLKDSVSIPIIENFLGLSYVENYGAGFGILQNKKFFLVFITGIVILGMIYFLYRNYNRMNTVVKIALMLLISGSIGNIIDRIRLSYVVDFISVRFPFGYNFPVFNVADILVVIGTTLLMIVVLFDKDFNI